MRSDRISVRPAGIVAQIEGIGFLVVAGFPALGHAGGEGAVGILCQQALEQVARDGRPGDILDQLRIDRRRLGAHVVGEHLLVGKRFAGDRVGFCGQGIVCEQQGEQGARQGFQQ